MSYINRGRARMGRESIVREYIIPLSEEYCGRITVKARNLEKAMNLVINNYEEVFEKELNEIKKRKGRN